MLFISLGKLDGRQRFHNHATGALLDGDAIAPRSSPRYRQGSSMAGGSILAIDQGTTSTRAMVFDQNAHVLAVAQKELPQIFPADGWVEHDPEEIWNATLAVCREVL